MPPAAAKKSWSFAGAKEASSARRAAGFTSTSNIGKEAARQLAVRFGSRLFPIGLHQVAKKKTDGVYMSVKEGGTMIEYEDEDAEIRRRYEAELKRLGTPLRMRS